jgi:hypothetical protein
MLSLTRRCSAAARTFGAEVRRFGEPLHNELHSRKGAGRIVEIVRKIDTVRWPRG